MIPKLLTIAVALLSLVSSRIGAQEPNATSHTNSLRPGDIIQCTNVWTIHGPKTNHSDGALLSRRD